MRHHKYNEDFKFIEEPLEFNKYSEKEFLQYCLGATMYMPGTKDFTNKILNNELPGLTSMVLCFEDACPEKDVTKAEDNTIRLLEILASAIDAGNITYENIPLIFCRVRSVEQFKNFSKSLTKEHCKILAGFNFPKFTSECGE